MFIKHDNITINGADIFPGKLSFNLLSLLFINQLLLAKVVGFSFAGIAAPLFYIWDVHFLQFIIHNNLLTEENTYTQ